MNSELNRLTDVISKYNATYWIISKGNEKVEYYEGESVEISISELETAFNELQNGDYIFKARAGKNSYNSQLVRRFTKGHSNPNTNTGMDTQAMILFTQSLAEIKLRQEQMHTEIKEIAKAVVILTDSDKSNDSTGLEMLETISKGAKVVGSLKDIFKQNP
ncbi:MAG: hypothetical protein MUF58_11825 [Arcicella sp.]|jgi:HAMP domain-containing protein|nr:hypothetical protein [Arcicella sp.]